jgi:hypothetical protein
VEFKFHASENKSLTLQRKQIKKSGGGDVKTEHMFAGLGGGGGSVM